jgi:hypothetical protein
MDAAFRSSFWLEGALSLACGLAAVMTLFWRGWIEALTGFDPDHGNGWAEWMVVAALAVATVLLGAVARREWRRLRVLSVAAN